MKKIPSKFKIANQEFRVEIADNLTARDDKDCPILGDFSYAPPLIRIAKYNGDAVLTEEQIANTFYHELFHCFQYMYNTDYSESEAQTFANFMCEFNSTKK